MSTKDTPIWLDIKTEYIDTNLDKVIDYLSSQSLQSKTDSFYQMTRELLEKRVKELLWQLSNKAIETEETNVSKKEVLPNIRLLGAYILDQNNRTENTVREAYFFFIKLLISAVPATYSEGLCEIAIKCFTNKGINSCGFNWDDLKSDRLEVMAFKIINNVQFTSELYPLAWYQNKGSLKVDKGRIELFEKNRDDSTYKKFSSSLGVLDEKIIMQTASSDKIPQSKADDVAVMDAFTVGIMREQVKTIPSPEKGLKQYQEGDKMIVKYTGLDIYGNMRVETMEGDYEKICGIVPSWGKAYLNFYTGQQVGSYLAENSYFEAVYKGGNQKHFDISESFVKAMIDNTISVGDEVNAVLKSIKNGLMMWWTECGYPAYVAGKYVNLDYDIGDTAYIEIVNCATNAYVTARIIEPSNQPVDEEDSRYYCINGFPFEEDPIFSKAPSKNKVSLLFVKGLCRLLYIYQQSLGDASERFRVLSICRILANMTEDLEALQYLDLASEYIHNLVRFAKNEAKKIELFELSEKTASIPSVLRWQAVSKVLKAYGEDEDEVLNDIINNKEEIDPLIVKLAKLIQSSNRIDDVYPAIKTVIRSEITKMLAVETVDNADFEKASGPNLGLENRRMEFKTSFFFPPQDAKEKFQEKNIFKSLSSLLNTSEGGDLYLGVNNEGGINGLDNDIYHLEHKIVEGNYKGLDGYIRYIEERAKNYFDLDVRLHFHIDSMYDGSVVRIQVDPYENGVVDFCGEAYVRNNNGLALMDPATRRYIESKRLKAKDDQSKIILALSEAIREEKKVVLHKYASSSSDNVRDRNVEPFAFIGRNSFVWCYDLDDDSNKLFRVSRIGGLEILKDNWSKKDKHKKGKTDIFNLTGDKPIPVKLELDLMARNLLIEEYPDSASEMYPVAENTWALETVVYNMVGLGRFYVGLAEHIKIVEAPDLVDYAKDYIKGIQKKLV